jgi:hypothetical protein
VRITSNVGLETREEATPSKIESIHSLELATSGVIRRTVTAHIETSRRLSSLPSSYSRMMDGLWRNEWLRVERGEGQLGSEKGEDNDFTKPRGSTSESSHREDLRRWPCRPVEPRYCTKGPRSVAARAFTELSSLVQPRRLAGVATFYSRIVHA